MRVAALLTGRGNNTLRDKNVIPVLGRPLCQYPAMAARNCGLVTDFYASSDDEKILAAAAAVGYRRIVRPAGLASPSAQHVDVIIHALGAMRDDGCEPDILVVLLANNAITRTEWIEESVRNLAGDPSLSASCPVMLEQDRHPYRCKRLREDGCLDTWFDFGGRAISTNRQDLPANFVLCHNFWTLRLSNSVYGEGGGEDSPPGTSWATASSRLSWRKASTCTTWTTWPARKGGSGRRAWRDSRPARDASFPRGRARLPSRPRPGASRGRGGRRLPRRPRCGKEGAMNMPGILDCTLRDGGYYTCWDFDPSIVDSYVEAMNGLPVDYIEVGYRNNPSGEYMGKLGYTPLSVLRHIRRLSGKKLAVMLNEKSTRPGDLGTLLAPIRGAADMVRIAIDPGNFDRAVVLAKAVKDLGFEVGVNIMYMSTWKGLDGFLGKLGQVDGVADMVCMVDSYGGVTPDDVACITGAVRENTSCPVGFHGHNNLQLGLSNALAAIACGVDFVDATILGMGRGAGNLSMELLLTYLNRLGLKVDFNVLGDAVSAFQPLLDKYRWGTNLPYMLAGANSIPQKEVMEWATNRSYSFNSIVRAVDNRRNHLEDNARYPLFEGRSCRRALVIGGGSSVTAHKDAIREYVAMRPDMALVFVTARYVPYFVHEINDKYFMLVGNEAKRMKRNLKPEEFKGTCVLPPYPRKMGTEVPKYAEKATFELEGISFIDCYRDSCTATALQTALELGAERIEVVGYDGYMGEVLSEKETVLTNENRAIFRAFAEKRGVEMYSLTPTLYRELEVRSIYQYL